MPYLTVCHFAADTGIGEGVGFFSAGKKKRKFTLTPAGEYLYKKSLVLVADYEQMCHYNVVHTGGGKGKASECIKCGKCETACPQHLHIRDLLADVAKEFEKR